MSTRRCVRCGSATGARAFEFPAPAGSVVKCLPCALRHRPMLGRSFAIALLVGTVLVAINQGDLLLHWLWQPALLWKVPLTYAVPFLVATWSALLTGRIRPGRG